MSSAQRSIRQARLESAVPHIQQALKRLLQAWDAVSAAENILGFEITTDELQDLAGGLDGPETVREKVTSEIVREWLENIRFAAK